jgi:hypothetical protein
MRDKREPSSQGKRSPSLRSVAVRAGCRSGLILRRMADDGIAAMSDPKRPIIENVELAVQNRDGERIR